MDKDKKTKSKILITLLILITVCCIAITVWAVFFRSNTETVLSPDRAPQKTEENAEKIENDNTEKMKADVGYTLTCSVDSEYSNFYLGTDKYSMLGSDTGTLKTAENTAVENAPSKQLTIYPLGSLPAGTNDANVATLTITIGAK